MHEFNKQLFKSYCIHIHFYLCENNAYIWAHVCALVHVEIKRQFDSINSFLKTYGSQGLESGSSSIMEGSFACRAISQAQNVFLKFTFIAHLLSILVMIENRFSIPQLKLTVITE